MDRSKLVEEARELARRLDCDATQRLPGLPYEGSSWLRSLSPTLSALAKIVEEQNVRITRLAEAADRPDPVRAEALAACVACDEALNYVIAHPNATRNLVYWTKLNEIRHLARRAVELAEPKGDIEEVQLKHDTLPELVEHTFAALRTPGPLAVGAVKLAESEVDHVEETMKLTEAEAELWSQIAPRLQRALGLAPPTIEEADAEMAEAEAVPMTDEEIEAIAEGATNQASEPPGYSKKHDGDRYAELMCIRSTRSLTSQEEIEWQQCGLIGPAFEQHTESPAPPIEIEMRCLGAGSGWTWQHRLADYWFEFPGAFHNEKSTRHHANKQLAALSEQLGVPLVGVWKAKANSEKKCQICGRPVAPIRGEVPMICSGCASE